MITIIQGLIITLFEAFGCMMFFNIFLKARVIYKWSNWFLFISLVIGFLCVSLLDVGSYLLKILSAMLTIIVIMWIYYKKHIIQIVFLSVGFYALVYAIDYIMVDIIQSLTEESVWLHPFRSTLLALLCKTVLLFVILLLSRKLDKTGSLNLITDSEWIRFLFFPVLTIISLVGFTTVGEDGSDKMNFFVSFGLVTANFLLFLIIRDIMQREKKMLDIRVSEERTKNQMNMYLTMDDSYNEQKKKVHEFNNQLACMRQLLGSKEYEKAAEYVNGICNSWTEEMNYINTNHAIINAVLNQKFKLAKSKGIAMVLSLNDLHDVFISDEDLVTLLSNLLDNAIEACEKLIEGNKIIKFRFIVEGEKITISARNPVKDNIYILDNYPVTTKRNIFEHGIGMRNMETVIKRYGGEYQYSCNEGYFTYTMIFERLIFERHIFERHSQ